MVSAGRPVSGVLMSYAHWADATVVMGIYRYRCQLVPGSGGNVGTKRGTAINQYKVVEQVPCGRVISGEGWKQTKVGDERRSGVSPGRTWFAVVSVAWYNYCVATRL